MKSIAATCSLCLLLITSPAIGADCDNWNTKEFFKTTPPKAVTGCLQAGIDVNTRDEKTGSTLLHWAAASNKAPAVITALLQAGADPKARDKDGWTPLHWAARFNEDPAAINALLQAGADPNTRTKDGRTSGDLAEENEALKDSDVYERLKEGN